MDTMRERFTTVAVDLLENNRDVAIVLAAIGVGQFDELGAFDRHPERIVDMGIREQTMIGVAAGLALSGLRPIVHTYAPFLVERPFEQVKLDFAHQDVGGVLVSVGASHDVASAGRTHMAPGDVSLLATLPGWDIYVPGHPDEVEVALRRAAAADNRVYIRLSEQMNQEPHSVTGYIDIIRRGTRPSPLVIAVGPMLDAVTDATAHLDATVAYVSTVRPLDAKGIRAAATGTDVIIVEPYLEGTSVAPLAAALADRPHRVLGIGVGNEELRKYGTAAEHNRAWGLDRESLRSRIDRFVRPLQLES
ncbi:MAG: transketolase [Acidimicrobiia bacterium]|nr:transketolase [Acidimicrobiia bacterium]